MMCMCVYNVLIMVFTAMSGIGACAAVFASIFIYSRQKKIALFERRVQVLNEYERFVFEELPDWHWDGQIGIITKYSEQEVVSLFNNEYGLLRKEIIRTAKRCNILIGDMNYAGRHGSCNDKTEEQIEKEKLGLEKELQSLFSIMRGKAYDKWLKL